ncbi:hypothetical protein GGR58DRAFT_529155 [Xylaria digitata]|nr:hypothetical protein GGR58DRAFT_529155 [Xylaria digitata]
MDPQHSTTPSSSTVASLPPSVPVSTYSTYRPCTFQPTCTHLSMTHREHLIVDALEKNQPVSFDSLGAVFGNVISPGPRSPERRADKLSFFGEVTAEQMRTYSPTQLATILEQRDNLLAVVSQQHQASSKAQQLYYPSGTYRGSLLKPPPGVVDTKPWVPHEDEECQAKYCHRCRPSCELRSYLSLDGILNGDIPPTAATGFGFHRMRIRPIVNAGIVREIGLRPVPWPRAEPHTYPSSPASQSTLTLSDIIEDQVMEPDYIDPEPQLELGDGSTIDSVVSTPSHASVFEQPRPAFTPPSTPASWTGIARQDSGTMVFEHCPFVCDGRSPESLKTNLAVCHRVIGSIAGLMHQTLDEDEMEEFQSICLFEPTDKSKTLGPGPVSTTLRISGNDKDQGGVTPIEGRFHHGVRDVREGFAVTEENVKLRAPDVIAHI